MKYILLILLFVLPLQISAQKLKCSFSVPKYKIGKQKKIGLAIIAFAGLVDGMGAGYEFDSRKSFERKYGVDPNGFWGSKSWKKRYKNPNIWNRHFGVFDFYHLADDVRKVGYLSGGIMITLGGKKQKWYYYFCDFALAFAVSSATKRIGMHWIRN